jgi:Na+/H+ antiporter NhaD/arsenite permease-like protein
VLVAGLLLVGLVAGEDGLFDAAAARLVVLPGPPVVLLLACFLLVAVVTALLNLDTSVIAYSRQGLVLAPLALLGALALGSGWP